jgi:acetyl/propionyl-CoA carboxylase alpha subunit/acetyl-CoA carboxylase carboxyltransferase component
MSGAGAIGAVLVANRGEIALRILRAASELGLRTVSVHSQDDAAGLHTRRADATFRLPGRGARAYLDPDALIEAARQTGCDAIHPGYGFLSESSELAARCAAAGLVFVGPKPEQLSVFGDKLAARALAEQCGVPVVPGAVVANVEQARDFFASLHELASLEVPASVQKRAEAQAGRASEAMVLKAVAGGGGRGMRVVASPEEIEGAFARCRSEAEAAFGNGALYAERLVPRARHVEVQIAGDATGAVMHLGERECTLQRRHQKLVEVAPSPGLPTALRARLLDAALGLARSQAYLNLGTFEFLLDAGSSPLSATADFWFIEANPRLQVEHTVTEAVTGVDLVKLQLQLAGGCSLADLALDPKQPPEAFGQAIQLRVNLETMGPGGDVRPSAGCITAWELPSGPGIRVDGAGYVGYAPNPSFDALIAKVIVHARGDGYRDLLVRAGRALAELRVEGVETNVPFLQALLVHPDVLADRIDTRFVERHAAELVAAAGAQPRRHFRFDDLASAAPEAGAGVGESGAGESGAGRAGARIDAADPLAVLAHGKQPGAVRRASGTSPEADGALLLRAPLQGTVVSVDAAPGQVVAAGAPLVVLEAMKMEHVLEAPHAARVRRVDVAPGDTIYEGHVLVVLEETEAPGSEGVRAQELDLEAIRPDLAEVLERHAKGQDAARPEATARRRATGQRTTRENVADLCDPGSFVEYGPLVIAAQRRRRSLEDLIARTPADGLVAGVGRVNGARFGERASRCVVMSYDYTVLAGTQGLQNHRKKDRLFEFAEQQRLPVVFFTEGGGGRPGDTDGAGVAGLDCLAFQYFGRLSGLVPLVGINSGRCFAGNAALLGCCDVVIASADSNIGMGGPAMIEGGGLGVFRPEEVGPIEVQVPNGVVDLPVADEVEAVDVAKRYLSYFQGATRDWSCGDPRRLRHAIPENRLRVYDVRSVIRELCDTDSVLELRRGFGPGMVTALARIEGRPLGVIANNPVHLAGAIDSPGADKAARFMQLCDAFDLPILFLCDTPGIMVGPEAEKTALVRHAARLFVTGASLSVPFFTIVLRKGYGLGAQAMAGGSFHAPLFTVAWPTGEFGGMGLEGAVKLGFRNELAAVTDAGERRALFQQMVDRMYAHGKAVNMASHFEIDDVIDPADSRRWILAALESAPPPPPRAGKKRPCIDTW